ncbi:unnamed protein product [Brassicogethes aeneus]|uniref:Uncharacterized protein n=1 Tax=Brassicogethes aeneus TaxID=1431903 RepID=A0A9P0FHC7_BRAAE|nr:unnamed protein product [Brassicogethes aeneus]
MEQNMSVISMVCRICYDNDKEEPLIAPCKCKGTVAFVHRSCLETWLAEANASTCELCHQPIKTERTPKHTTFQSIWIWCKTASSAGRGLRGDISACIFITPFAIVITYVCLFSSDYYNQSKFSTVPAAKWTSISLLAMIAVMLIGYYLWTYSVIRLHARLWYHWWQREAIVRYIPSSSIHLSDQETAINPPSNTPASLSDGDISDVEIVNCVNFSDTSVKATVEEINEFHRGDNVQ